MLVMRRNEVNWGEKRRGEKRHGAEALKSNCDGKKHEIEKKSKSRREKSDKTTFREFDVRQ